MSKPINTIRNSPSTDSPQSTNNNFTEKICYKGKGIVDVFIYLLLIFLALVMIPILPFLYISYHAFHGKYGIVKVLTDISKSM